MREQQDDWEIGKYCWEGCSTFEYGESTERERETEEGIGVGLN